jgi:hypothetical protein
VYLYWEVRATTLARAQARRPDGWLAVRLVSVIASWEGPRVDTLDLRVDSLYGDRFVRGVQPGANVRVSIGWKTVEEFGPFAVGVEVTAPRMVPVEPVASEVARWEPDAAMPERLHVAPDPSPAPWRMPDLGAAPPAPIEPAAPPAAEPRAAAPSPGRPGGQPVDSGVAIWRPSQSVPEDLGGDYDEVEEEIGDELLAFGGASDLVRRGGRGRRGLPGGPAFGGASDLAFGGASDLARGRSDGR